MIATASSKDTVYQFFREQSTNIVVSIFTFVLLCLVFAFRLNVSYLATIPVLFALLAAFLRWPDLATLASVGLIFSNIPVVAVKYHGAPSFLPAAAMALLVWPFCYRIFLKGDKLLVLPSALWVGVLAIVQFLGALISVDAHYSLNHFTEFLIEGVCVYVMLVNVVRTRRVALSCFAVLVACAILMGSVPLAQKLTGTTDFEYGGLAQMDGAFRTSEMEFDGEVIQRRSSGTIGEQNRYAQFMIVLAPISLALYYSLKSKPLRLFAIAGGICAFAGFSLAFSRGAAVGLLVTILVAIMLRLLNRRQIVGIVMLGCLAILVLPQYANRLSSMLGMAGQIAQPNGGITDNAVRGRLTEMLAALLAFRDHPLIGVGPGMFQKHSQDYGQIIGLRPLPEGRQAHSLPLDIAAEHGILGLIAMTMLFVVVLRYLILARQHAKKIRDRQGELLTTAMILSLTVYLSTSAFLHLSYIRYFWLLIGLCEAIAFLVWNGEKAKSYLPNWLLQPGAEHDKRLLAP